MLRVKNWDKFQHYKDRKPIWVKLYCSIIDPYHEDGAANKIRNLDDSAWRLYVSILVLASRFGGRVPDDASYIASETGAKPEHVGTLIQIGLLAKVAQDCTELLPPEKEKEKEKETEKETERARDSFESSFAQFPERVVEAYREHCPNLPQPAPGWRRGSTGAGILRLSDEIGQDLGVWVDVFQIANKAAFLREKRLGLDWLVKTPENWQNTASGRYSDAERLDPFAVLEGGAA